MISVVTASFAVHFTVEGPLKPLALTGAPLGSSPILRSEENLVNHTSSSVQSALAAKMDVATLAVG